MTLEQFSPDDPRTWSHPERFFAAARTQCPVAPFPGGGYVVTRWDDVRAASMRVKDFSNTRPVFGAGDPELEAIAADGYPEVPTLTNNDPPEHTRFRKLVYKAFVPEVVAGLEPKIRELAEGLITDAVDNGCAMDFVRDFTEILPIMVMADALGIPREDRAVFRVWSDNIVNSIMGFMVMDRETQFATKRSYVEFQHYFADLIEQRRAEPGEDMVSHLVHSRVDGERSLDVPEILDVLRALLVAGNDTTNLLGGTLLLLLDAPDQLAEVTADRSLVPQMIEEALRYLSPSRWNMRTVPHEGTELAGCPIPAGERVRLSWNAANWDGTYFPEPERFDIHRDTAKHMAFGHGIHFCIGKDLARTEARIVFDTVLDRMTDIELAVPRDEVEPMPIPGINRLNKLPIRFSACQQEVASTALSSAPQPAVTP
ncbi:MAG: cytochrome P450 [Sciscionella sp.]